MNAIKLERLRQLNLDDTENVIELLFELGHFIPSGLEDLGEIKAKCFEPSSNLYVDAVASLQDFMPVKKDGIFGNKTKKEFKDNRRCLCPDIQTAGVKPRWTIYDLRVWHDMQGLGDHNEVAAYNTALNMWAAPEIPGSPFTFKWIDSDNNRPNFFGHARRIDGVNRILAWHEMLARDGVKNTQLEFRVDSSEAWTQLWLLIATLAHEIGHGLGLYHINEPDALMYPSMNGTRKPGPDDIKELMALYKNVWGPIDPKPEPEPDPPKPKPPKPIPGEVEVLGELGNFVHQGYVYRSLLTRERL